MQKSYIKQNSSIYARTVNFEKKISLIRRQFIIYE